MSEKQGFGLVGLGVMGRGLAVNMARRGVRVVGTTLDLEAARRFADDHDELALEVAADVEELAAGLERPRRVLLMVPAGDPVDSVAEDLLPVLDEGDIVIDGGNSHFRDTERRQERAARSGVRWIGMGVSGGERGALEGPSLMPGGDRDAYGELEPVLQEIAAETDSGPCVGWCGERGAGHLVKMVHNGIEYGVMQVLAEAYDVLRHALGLEPSRLQEVFSDWNDGELSSYLVEITAEIVAFPDPEAGAAGGDDDAEDEEIAYLLDAIEDRAEQKGTGKWTTQEGLDLGVPTPTIAEAVGARYLSALQEQRRRGHEAYSGVQTAFAGDPGVAVDDLRDAVFCSALCSYAQGFAVLRQADEEGGYGIRLAEVARIWKGGCIVRAALLDDVLAAHRDDPELPNLLLAPALRKAVAPRVEGWRRTVALGTGLGLAVPGIGASLAYFDGHRRRRSPANLIMAMRDFFGSHGFERRDREGTFHADWPEVD